MNEIGRFDVDYLREALGRLGVVVAEVDHDLRYGWIVNPHPDFYSAEVVSKRDDELADADGLEIMNIKREVLGTGELGERVLRFSRSDGPHYYSLSVFPIRENDGRRDRLLTIAFDLSVAAFDKAFKASTV